MEIIKRNAVFSECRKYRYELERVWDVDGELVMFIGLNPSTADENTDDATIRRCMGFAEANGFGGMRMLNLYAFCATKPEDMWKCAEPVSEPGGNKNDVALMENAKKCGAVVFAWGGNAAGDSRYRDVIKMFPGALCFGLTMTGQPKHPLYLDATTLLELYSESSSGKYKELKG